MTLNIPLPVGYDFAFLQRFYSRDPEPTSEKVQANTITKNILHQGQPVQLCITAKGQELQVQQFSKAPLEENQLKALTLHLAGLKQNTQALVEQHQHHPEVGALIEQAPALFVPQLMPFEALSWAIIGQLISVAAATTIRRRFILAGEKEYQGLWAYPDAKTTLQIGLERLRSLGFSATKANALLTAAELHSQDANFLPVSLARTSAKSLHQELQKISGVGPWTAQYTLLRGYNYLAADLSGDLAVRRALGLLQAHQNLEKTPPSISETRAWLAQFAPYQALVAAHLWHWQAQHF